jgi:DNA-binding transcriptional MerR regulator
MAYITHYYTPDEIRIIACDLKANVPVKRIARLRGIDFNRKGDGMLKKIRQIKRALEKGFTIEDILKKKTTETYNKKPEPMRELKFYSVEEINIMKTDIATGQPIKQIARRLAKEFNRPAPGLEQKLYGLKKTVPHIAKWNGPRLKKTAVKKIKPIVEQQPAEVGVEVPHGMTFEGKPKRIMLHSDHFRIYF